MIPGKWRMARTSLRWNLFYFVAAIDDNVEYADSMKNANKTKTSKTRRIVFSLEIVTIIYLNI